METMKPKNNQDNTAENQEDCNADYLFHNPDLVYNDTWMLEITRQITVRVSKSDESSF